MTLPAAKASALMEAVETWHAEQIASSDVRGTFQDLAARGLPAVDPARLPRAADSRTNAADTEFDWIEGRDLFTGAHRLVPIDLVSANYTLGSATIGSLQATTSGLAAGNDLWEALSHALCEAIERDAVALWRLLPDAAQDATTLDLSTAVPTIHSALLEKFAAAGIEVRAFDVTSDIRVASVLCLLGPGDNNDEMQPELGSGCHPDPVVALCRALSEAAQARLTRISGARDDLVLSSYEIAPRASRARAARTWLRATRCHEHARNCDSLPTCAQSTIRRDVVEMLECLVRAGIHEAIWVDLTDPNIGVPAVRVVVPGLEGPAAPVGGGYVPGARARLRQAGLL
jgi:YcaO-like protein with predicted kinase domain